MRSDWLLEAAKTHGWPPKGKCWDAILLNESLDYWRHTDWNLEELNLSEVLWSADTTSIIQEMRSGIIGNILNAFNTRGERTRHQELLTYMFQHGRFPRPVSLVGLTETNCYRIADGHHRILAWDTSGSILSALPSLPARDVTALKLALNNKYGTESIAPFLPIQTVWVARKSSAQ